MEPLCRRLSSLSRACCSFMIPKLRVILNGVVSSYELTFKRLQSNYSNGLAITSSLVRQARPLRTEKLTPDLVFYTDQLKVPGTGVEPARPRARDPKSRVSTNSTIPALEQDQYNKINHYGNGFLTRNSFPR